MNSREKDQEKIKKESGFDYLDKPIKLDLDSCLFVTHCCADKNPLLQKGLAEQLYIGNRNKTFYYWVKSKKVKYCTFSDKYGLIKPDQIIETYNVAPTDLSPSDIEEMRKRVKEQIPEGIKTIVYYGLSPRMTEFYLKMFKDVDLEKIFITRFSFIDNFKTKSLF